MKGLNFKPLALLVSLSALLLWTGCNTDNPPIIPDDSDPTVTLISPTRSYDLAYRGDDVSVTFRLDDNESLRSYWVQETWTSVLGTVYHKDHAVLLGPEDVSGNHFALTVDYTVPITIVQDYTTITLDVYATDNKDKVAMSTFEISVLPEPGTTSDFKIQEYEECDTIYSQLTGSNFYFSLINRSNVVDIAADRDLGEASTTGFDAVLEAPNQGGVDSVFVVTNAGDFNYDELTWETTWQAFVTSNNIGMTTPPLSAGDIVILKMFNAPHFAVLRIKEIQSLGGLIIFQYKYTFED